jgi:hypothetical protein
METISMGGRPVAGFAVGEIGLAGEGAPPGTVSPRYAALMTGAAAGLLAHALDAPLWGDIAVGVVAAVVTKASIDKAASA